MMQQILGPMEPGIPLRNSGQEQMAACTRERKGGDVVVIMEDNLPPNTWRIGRITATHPGPDSLVRSAIMDVVMPGGGKHAMKRPVQKLCRLVEAES